jgi:hypothetical protein
MVHGIVGIVRLQMKQIGYSSLKIFIGIWLIGNITVLSMTYSGQDSSIPTQLSEGSSPTKTDCPKDLSILQSKMEEALQFVKSSSFRDTLLASLQASIPEAIAQADGLAGQITFLKQEIGRQEQERAHAEEVARESLDDPSKALVPCRTGMEGSYCHAVDQYYASIAANLANKAFLEALECYQGKEVR